MKKLILARKLSQALFLLLFIYLLWLTPHTAAFFKIDPLISIFSLFSLIMLGATLIIGRFFCGWVCPLGTIIDVCGIKAKNRDTGFLRKVKYYVLGVIVIFAFLGIQIAWIFDPLVITARFISLNFIPSFTLALDKSFIFLIKSLNFYAPLYDFYRMLKLSILGTKIFYFPHSFITLSFFVIICGLAFATKRFWCRIICPLGAIYSIVAKFSILIRRVDKCVNCMKCKINCRMSAINEDMSYKKSECVLCMDCVYDCPVHSTRFVWPAKPAKPQAKDSITRKDFLFLIASSFLFLGFKGREEAAKKKLIRPPGVKNEHEFLNKCIRCGNCMKICPTNGLQPAIFESGLIGIWAPHLVPEIGYCEYNCNLCGNVCPTGAIPKLSLVQKQEQKLGTAFIDKFICLPWSQNKECIVCEEHCPVPSKAIKTYEEVIAGKKIRKPYVDISLCVGCGICQNKCPTRPERAIRVLP
ncbi:MAG: 4Fe-4S binding protein [Candidatus Omnitrophica bacterium]|nr:4Fe-4S binding protein [Candidatus Omnitrophota bacterium]